MPLLKFSIDLLNEVAEECEQRAISTESNADFFAFAANELADLMEILVETDCT